MNKLRTLIKIAGIDRDAIAERLAPLVARKIGKRVNFYNDDGQSTRFSDDEGNIFAVDSEDPNDTPYLAYRHRQYRPVGHLELNPMTNKRHVFSEVSLGDLKPGRKLRRQILDIMSRERNSDDWNDLATPDHFSSDDNIRLYFGTEVSQDAKKREIKKALVKAIRQWKAGREKNWDSDVYATRLNSKGVPLSSFADMALDNHNGELSVDMRS